MQAQSTNYQAYLVRFWRTGHEADWRVVIKNIQTDEQHHIVSVQQLFGFLIEHLSAENLDQPTDFSAPNTL